MAKEKFGDKFLGNVEFVNRRWMCDVECNMCPNVRRIQVTRKQNGVCVSCSQSIRVRSTEKYSLQKLMDNQFFVELVPKEKGSHDRYGIFLCSCGCGAKKKKKMYTCYLNRVNSNCFNIKKYSGVYKNKGYQNYSFRVSKDRRSMSMSGFDNEEDAALARDQLLIDLGLNNDPRIRLNFSEQYLKSMSKKLYLSDVKVTTLPKNVYKYEAGYYFDRVIDGDRYTKYNTSLDVILKYKKQFDRSIEIQDEARKLAKEQK